MAKSIADIQGEQAVATPPPPSTELSTGKSEVPATNLAVTSQMTEEQEYEAMMASPEMKQIKESMNQNVNARAEIRTQRLAIMQGKSPEVDKSLPGYKQGQIVNNVTREILTVYVKPRWLIEKGVPESEISTLYHQMAFIPIFKLPTEFTHWKTEAERVDGESKYHFKTLDDTDIRVINGVWPDRGGRWGTTPETKGLAPPVTSSINWLVLPVNLETRQIQAAPIVASFNRTSENAGKLLTKFVNDHGIEGLPPFGRVYHLYTMHTQYSEKKSSQVMHVTHGIKVWDFNKSLLKTCFGLANYLGDKVEGPQRQEEMLNFAQDVDDASHQDEEALQPSTNNPVSQGEPDPFDDSTPVSDFPE